MNKRRRSNVDISDCYMKCHPVALLGESGGCSLQIEGVQLQLKGGQKAMRQHAYVTAMPSICFCFVSIRRTFVSDVRYTVSTWSGVSAEGTKENERTPVRNSC